MRFFIFATLFIVSSHAHAWGDDFSFTVSSSASPGCVHVDSVMTPNDFPTYKNSTVTAIRFYFSRKSHLDVTENSDYQESGFAKDENDSYTPTNPDMCGLESGHYYFMYGVVDETGKLIAFQSQDDYQAASQQAEVH